jgi:hypothetical protein
MHEVGHTLGLRHNFRGSAGVSAANLADRAYTADRGTAASVMDYTPPAIARDPAQQGDIYSRTVGSYDRWAIAYGYAPVPDAERPAAGGKGAAEDDPAHRPADAELNALRVRASQAADPAFLYATDEDAGFGGFGLDPAVSRYDLTDDPLAWAKERVALIDGLFDSLETRVVAPGQGYTSLRTAFTDLLTDRWYATLVTTKYLAGATTSRDHRGDPGARPALTTIPAARQREALAFLTEAAFGEHAYRLRPELLSRLAPDRWMHWGTNPAAQGRIDFPLHDWASTQQNSILNQLFDPAVLARLRDAELRAAEGDDVMSIPELFGTITAAIWSETGLRADGKAAKPAHRIGAIRRDLQRAELASLIRMVIAPLPGTPEDARTMARQTLVALGAQLDRALKSAGAAQDPSTHAHLADSRERISRALDAQMLQTNAR